MPASSPSSSTPSSGSAASKSSSSSVGSQTLMSINSQISNYLSNKQCCLETLTMEALNSLKIGNKDARCKQKEVIFGNILFEVLACTSIARDSFISSVDPSVSIPNGYNVTLYINDIQVSDTLTILPSGFGQYLLNNINNYSSILDVLVVKSGSYSTVYINSNVIEQPYYAYALTDYPSIPRVDFTLTDIATYGNQCLTEEDVCLMTPYLNKICESC